MEDIKKLSIKEQKALDSKILQDRKDKDKLKNYQYFSCPYCSNAVKWFGTHKPIHCGEEECAKKFFIEKQERLKNV